MTDEAHAEHGLRSNTLWALVNEGLTVLAAVFSVLLLIPRLGDVGYGAYAAIFALVGPITSFAHTGVSLTVLEHTVGNRERGSDVMRSCLGFSMLLSTIAAPLVVIVTSIINPKLGVWPAVLIVFSELVLQALWFTVVSSVQGAHGFRSGIGLRIFAIVVRLLALTVVVLIDQVTLLNVAVANVVASVVSTGVTVVLARRVGLGWALPGRMQRAHAKSSFTYGFGLSASTAQNDGDKVALNAYNHYADGGVYAAAYRVVSFWMVPLSALVNSTHYAVLRSVGGRDDQLHRALRFAKVAAIFAVPMTALLLVAAPYAPRFLGNGDEFEGATTMIRLLAPLILFRGLGTFALNGLLGLGRTKLRAGVLLTSAVVSIILYITLIPAHSWRGAVVATLISDALLFVLCWVSLYVCQKKADGQHGPDIPMHVEPMGAELA